LTKKGKYGRIKEKKEIFFWESVMKKVKAIILGVEIILLVFQ